MDPLPHDGGEGAYMEESESNDAAEKKNNRMLERSLLTKGLEAAFEPS